MKKYDVHAFICTSCTFKDQKGEDCPPQTAGDFRKELKKMASERWPKDSPGPSVRINGSGCLGQCEHGIASVIYPQGQWHLNLRPNRPEELLDAVSDVVSQVSKGLRR